MGELYKYLDIDGIRANPNTKIIFALPTGPVNAYMIGDTFDIGGSNEYNTVKEVIETAAGDLLGGISAARDKYAGIVSMTTGRTGRNQMESIMNYTGSAKPDFSLEVAMQSIRPGEDVREFAWKFLEGVFPENGGRGFFKAPWGYRAVAKKGGPASKTGRIAVSIGKWFRAPNMVMKSANFQFSKQTVPDGSPLFVAGTIAFEPDQELFASQLKGMFFPQYSVS